MPINPYFTESGGTTNQKTLYEDLIIESIQIYGQSFYYVPREIVAEDQLFGEDRISAFNNGYEVEMYVENNAGFEGAELFQKFGAEIRDDAVLVISKRRWTTEVVTNGGESLIRPREGDLVYFPFADALFEIHFVEHEDPFYQLNNLPVYKLSVSLFEISGDEVNLESIGFDEGEYASTWEITVTDSVGFQVDEHLSQLNGTVTVTGKIQSIEGNVLIVSNVNNDTSDFVTFGVGPDAVGSNSTATSSVTAVAPHETDFGDNDSIETETDGFTDFDPNNPFGSF